MHQILDGFITEQNTDDGEYPDLECCGCGVEIDVFVVSGSRHLIATCKYSYSTYRFQALKVHFNSFKKKVNLN